MIKWTDRVVGLACSLIKRIKKMSLQSKEGTLTMKITTGLPKESNLHGNGSVIISGNYTLSNKIHSLYVEGSSPRKKRTEVKLLSRRNYSGTVCTQNSVKKLDNLILRCKTHPYDKIDRPLYSILCDPYLLETAYNNIKNKPFRFKPGRRIQIPKASGGSRPLTIASPRDKIVQEAIRMILNAIYEPVFLENSHGFRPNKGCHTALKYVYTKFKSAT